MLVLAAAGTAVSALAVSKSGWRLSLAVLVCLRISSCLLRPSSVPWEKFLNKGEIYVFFFFFGGGGGPSHIQSSGNVLKIINSSN